MGTQIPADTVSVQAYFLEYVCNSMLLVMK